MIVDTEKVLREADGPMKRAVPRPVMRNVWKCVRPGVRLESGSGEPVRSPKNTRGNTVNWVDINLAQKKGLMFNQTGSNAIIFYNTLPAYCTPKAVRMETGEIKYEKVYESPRPPPKISLRNDLMKKLLDKQKTTNQPNQTLIQFIERRDPL